MRGRKPKPAEAKILTGNFRKDRSVEQEPVVDEDLDITAPEWLDYEAKKTWDYYAPRLKNSRVLTALDLHNLEIFCTNYSIWRRALHEIEVEGVTVQGAMGGTVKNPAITVASEASKIMISVGSNLGIDPVSRTRINVGKQKPAGNPFANL